MAGQVSPRAGKPIEPSMLVNVPRLVTAYFAGTVSCATGYCDPGNSCYFFGGVPKCVPTQHLKAAAIRYWLAKNSASFTGEIEERNKKGLEYALSNQEFVNAVGDVVASNTTSITA